MRKSKRRSKTKTSPWLRAALGPANSNGFYILEFPGPPVIWTIYNRASGHAVAKYWPASGRWHGLGHLDGESGEDPGFRGFINRLARMEADRGQPSRAARSGKTLEGRAPRPLNSVDVRTYTTGDDQ